MIEGSFSRGLLLLSATVVCLALWPARVDAFKPQLASLVVEVSRTDIVAEPMEKRKLEIWFAEEGTLSFVRNHPGERDLRVDTDVVRDTLFGILSVEYIFDPSW